MHFRRKFRHPRSIRRPRCHIKVLNFGDLATCFLHLIFWMSAIFLLPVCLTYWPKKYTTRVDPHVDNYHQVSSWCDHTLPSYSVFVCWYVTWLCDLEFWPFDLEQLLCMAGHVTNLATKFEDPTPIRTVRAVEPPSWHFWRPRRDYKTSVSFWRDKTDRSRRDLKK